MSGNISGKLVEHYMSSLPRAFGHCYSCLLQKQAIQHKMHLAYGRKAHSLITMLPCVHVTKSVALPGSVHTKLDKYTGQTQKGALPLCSHITTAYASSVLNGTITPRQCHYNVVTSRRYCIGQRLHKISYRWM